MPRFARPRRGQLTALSITTGITAVAALMGSVLVPGLAAARNTVAHNAATAGAALVTDPASLVNPFIGTTNRPTTSPGADVPVRHGAVEPGHALRPDGGGYEYNDSSITGFSLTHLAGARLRREGDMPVLPTVGAVQHRRDRRVLALQRVRRRRVLQGGARQRGDHPADRDHPQRHGAASPSPPRPRPT